MLAHELGSRRHRLRAVDDGQAAHLELLDAILVGLRLDQVADGRDAIVQVEEVRRGVMQGRLDGLVNIRLAAAEEVADVALVQGLAVRLMQGHQVRQPRDTVVRGSRAFDFRVLLQRDIRVHGLVGLFRQQVAGDLGRRVVLHLLDQPLFVEVFVVEQGLQGVAGRLRYTIAGVGHDQLDVAARIECALDISLPIQDVPVERGEVLFEQQANALAERQCILLLELLGLLQLGLQKVQRLRRRVIADRVDALVVEVVNDRGSGRLRRDVEQLVQGEGAEGP